MKINLSFSSNNTIEEITKYVQRYIFEHKNDIEIDQTKNADYIIKYTLIKSDESLWD